MAESSTIPIICGPTGSGKTRIAVELAARFPIEVVSADSRQIIKHLDIGTAKPTAEECNKVRFHLVDLIEPGEGYSAYRFVDDACAALADIIGRDRIPVLVGGTGLYLRALTDGVVEIDNEDTTIRNQLQDEMTRIGQQAMYDQLARVDPTEAARLHPNNQVRVIRALEIYRLTGRPKSELLAETAHRKGEYSFEHFCLLPDRQELYAAIDRRVDQMMAAGWPAELERLVDAGMGEAIRQARVIGYGELLQFMDGELTLEAAVDLIKQNSRRYAKRQYTWFRNKTSGRFFSSRGELTSVLADQFSAKRGK
ncbi:MAG: tRNA (adenosine(37)-N6)-dimethylallyltransferase MiaA [candidate division Zixibacteria bacterium]|nr:tRNA (adenosine(37)-N6)-dimethylallyltransferase MiaA [candidate division Zixibacteria bacterium]